MRILQVPAKEAQAGDELRTTIGWMRIDKIVPVIEDGRVEVHTAGYGMKVLGEGFPVTVRRRTQEGNDKW